LTHIPSDLDSLGWVHADDRRGELIDLIEARKADGLITLWLDDGLSEPVPMPRNYRLEWVGGTAQGPGYECEVTAALPPLHAQNDHLFPRAVFEWENMLCGTWPEPDIEPSIELYHEGLKGTPRRVLIRKTDLERLSSEAHSSGRLEPNDGGSNQAECPETQFRKLAEEYKRTAARPSERGLLKLRTKENVVLTDLAVKEVAKSLGIHGDPGRSRKHSA
jgi:hypothetical protein